MNPCEDSAKALFDRLIELESPEERVRLLDAECGADLELRADVEGLLLAYDQAGSFLEHPVFGDVPTVVFRGTDTDPHAEDCKTVTKKPEIPPGLLAPSENESSQGRLGQYEILESIGRGGMGIVLKGHDTKLNRVVAIKVLAPELASNATARKRFLREAQAAAAVSHDHIVTIYAVEENERAGEATLPFLVMECIDGQSLQEKIDRQGPLELKEVLRIGRQIASGLAAAHEQGLIHRDVKPSNILLQNGIERVQITDFGLARAVDDVGMTRTGEVTGTPQYMSPEQAQGHAVDARSDLFSLGSVMYAMCTGRSPFRAETTMAALRRVCDDTPRPIREINADIPDWLTGIIDQLLEKDPADRFQTATEVAELLGKHLAHLQGPGTTPFPGSIQPAERSGVSSPPLGAGISRHWLVAGLVLLLLAATFSVTEATGVTQLASTVIRIFTGEGTLVIEVDDPTVQFSLNGKELSISGAGIQELKLSPGKYQFQATKDGKPVREELVSIQRNGKRVIHVSREFSEAGTLRLPENVSAGDFDRNSSEPASTSQITQLRTIAEFDEVWSVDISPDGRYVLATGKKEVSNPLVKGAARVWRRDSGELLHTWRPTEIRVVCASPDSRNAALGAFDGNIYLFDIVSGQHVGKLEGENVPVKRLDFSGDGELLLAGHADGSVRLWNVSERRELQTIRVEPSVSCVWLSRNNQAALVSSYDAGSSVWDMESGKKLLQISEPRTSQHMTAIAADGRHVAFAYWKYYHPEPQYRKQIAIVDVKTGQVVRRLKGHIAAVANLHFLPDGVHLISSGLDKSIRVWNWTIGQQINKIELPDHLPLRLAISNDQKYLVTGSDAHTYPELQSSSDSTVRLWELPRSLWGQEQSLRPSNRAEH